MGRYTIRWTDFFSRHEKAFETVAAAIAFGMSEQQGFEVWDGEAVVYAWEVIGGGIWLVEQDA